LIACPYKTNVGGSSPSAPTIEAFGADRTSTPYRLIASADGWLPAEYREPLTADNAPLPVVIANTETSPELAFAT